MVAGYSNLNKSLIHNYFLHSVLLVINLLKQDKFLNSDSSDSFLSFPSSSPLFRKEGLGEILEQLVVGSR